MTINLKNLLNPEKKISKMGEFQELKELSLFKEEMINRFGLIPKEFSNYLSVMSLKLLAGK